MSTMSSPSRVPLVAARTRTETTDGGVKVAAPIDAGSHGSDGLLGLQWVAPGTEIVSWHAGADTHEVYHVVEGALCIRWDGEDPGSSDVSAGDSFFFPPSHQYSVENAGDQPVFVVWAMAPSSEE
jgi:mannose-6-phosphate isomerase-like protein (cupin superfamily)